MNTFVSNFVSKTIGSTDLSVKGLLGNSYQRINESLTKFKQLLIGNNPRYDSLVLAFTNNPELISDEMVSSGKVNVIDGANFTEISTDTAEDVLNGFIDAATNNGETLQDNAQATITDAKNRFYTIFNKYSENVSDKTIIDDKEILLSSTGVVSSYKEAILYKDIITGKYYFNNVIRSGDFIKKAAEIVKGHDMLSKLNTICFLENGTHNTTILSACQSLSSDQSITTIKGLLSNYATNNNFDPTILFANGLYPGIDELEDYAIQKYPVEQGKGCISSMWSVMKDMIESSTLNTAILSTIQSMQSFTSFGIEFFTTLKDKIGDKFNSVSNFIAGARNAWMRGGFAGLGSYILSYANAMSKITTDDGLLTFSDNKDLVPKQYIAGAIWTAISAIITVAGMIISIFSKIVGAVVAVIGAILGAIVKSITHDAEGQYAALQISDAVIYPISPYAIYQSKFQSSLMSTAMISQFESGSELLATYVPGGVVIIGPCTSNPDYLDDEDASWMQKYPECMLKFFPSIIPHNYNNKLKNFIHNINQYRPMFSDPNFNFSDVEQLIRFDKESVHAYLGTMNKDANYICELYESAAEEIQYTDRDDGLIKDSTKDELIRESIIQNCGWFILWAISVRGPLAEFPSSTTGYMAITAIMIDHEDWFYPIVRSAYDDEFLMGVAASDPSRKSYLYTEDPTWAIIAEFAVFAAAAPYHTQYGSDIRQLIKFGYIIDEVMDAPSRMTPALKTPSYDPDTFWFWVVFSAIVVTVLAVVTIVASFKLKKAINKKRAMNQASVENAWSQLADEPTAENYDAYRKAVKKNNLWSKFIGGTKYDYVNYWNGDTSNDPGVDTTSILSGFGDPAEGLDSLLINGDPVSQVQLSDVEDISEDNSQNINVLKLLIKGS